MDWTDDQAWAGVRAPVEACVGLPPAAYHDEAFAAVERERVFERGWVCVGVAPEVAEPGRLIVRTVGSRSIIVVRGSDGQVRGFLNACRHRGTELADVDCRLADTIRCPYHRWGYALDGRLVSTPRFDEVPRDGFDRAGWSLWPVRVAVWGCLLFACLDDETPDLGDWLGDLPERMGGYRLDEWAVHDSRTLHIEANWKVVSENFQEYYHLSWVHPELAKVSRVADHYRYQGPGRYCGQTTTPVSSDDRDEWMAMPAADWLDDSDSVSGRFVAIFPNVLLSVLPNHALVMRLVPDGPGSTIEECSFLLPPGSTPDSTTFASTRAFWFDVNDEDIDIVERAQRGIASAAEAAGPLAPRFEEPLNRFHRMLADLMTAESLAELPPPAGDAPGATFGTAENPTPPAIDARR